MFAQGDVFAGEQLVEVRYGEFCRAHDNSVGRDIAKALITPIEQANNSTYEIECRQHIDEAQQVANDNLVDLESKAFGVHDAQAQDAFSHRLPAPDPFQQNAIADGDHKI